MPLTWVCLASIPLQEPARTIRDFGTVRVEFRTAEFDLPGAKVTFTDGAKVFYGETVVSADTVTLERPQSDDPVAEATGHVHLSDPDGSIRATRLLLHPGKKTGQGDDVEIESSGVRIRASHLDIAPSEWTLDGVSATTCSRPLPTYLLKARRVVVHPGVEILAEGPEFSLFGHRVFGLRRYRYRLTNEVGNSFAPSIGYRKGEGFGLTQSGQVLLGPRSGVGFGFSSFPREHPGYHANVGHSLLANHEPVKSLVVQPEFNERFTSGYFDHVGIASPEQERERISQPVSLVSVGGYVNDRPFGRRSDEALTKPFELAYERAATFSGIAFDGILRLESVGPAGGTRQGRGVAELTAALPPLHLGRALEGVVRFDSAGYSGSTSFGWAQAQVGAVYRPSSHFTVGAAWVQAVQGGTPGLEADPLVSLHAFHLRTDLDLGPTKLRYLIKVDPASGKAYDHELRFSQVVGCVEPFVTLRQFPGSTVFGLSFRTDELLNKLRRRTALPTERHVLSGTHGS